VGQSKGVGRPGVTGRYLWAWRIQEETSKVCSMRRTIEGPALLGSFAEKENLLGE